MKKRVASLTLVLCLVLVLLPITAAASGDHSHGDVIFTKPLTAGSLTEGNYYLTGDLTGKLVIDGAVKLCLNGYKIDANGTGSVITINAGATLDIYDCNGSHGSHAAYTVDDPLSDDPSKTIPITGGLITGGTGTPGSSATISGGGVYLKGTDSGIATLNLYGGTIAGNTAGSGAGIYVNDFGTVNLHGGAVSYNGPADETDRTEGIGVYMRSLRNETTGGAYGSVNTLNVSGNTKIEGNWGGGIYVTNGNTTLSDNASISGNRGVMAGGIYFSNSNCSLTLSDNVSVTDNEGSQGGGIHVTGGTVTLSDNAKVTDNRGTSMNGGGVYVKPGSSSRISLTVSGSVQIKGNTLEGKDSDLILGDRWSKDQYVTIGKDGLTDGAWIGVSVGKEDQETFTTGGGAGYFKYFTCQTTGRFLTKTEDGTELALVPYAIEGVQTLEGKPTVVVNCTIGADYKWYSATETAVTDPNAAAAGASFDETSGKWTAGTRVDMFFPYFTLTMKEGERLTVTPETSGDPDSLPDEHFTFELTSMTEGGPSVWTYDPQNGAYILTAPADGDYTLQTEAMGAPPTISAVHLALGGTAVDEDAALDTTAPGTYVCKVTWPDGTVLVSDPVTVEAPPASAHSHPICGESCTHEGSHTAVTFTIPVTADMTSITADGNYYLTEDVTLTDDLRIQGTQASPVTVNLCLNGHSLSAARGKRILYVNEYATLNICDCDKTRSHSFTSPVTKAPVTVGGGLITGAAGSNGRAVYIRNGSLNLYGGTVAGNGDPNSEYSSWGQVYVQDGDFQMYGGAITHNATGHSGGGLAIQGGSAVLEGGSLTWNGIGKAEQTGGGAYVFGTSTVGTLTVHSGFDISNNKSGLKDGPGTDCNVTVERYNKGGRLILAGKPRVPIGVSMNQDLGAFTSGFGASGLALEECFVSEQPTGTFLTTVTEESATEAALVAYAITTHPTPDDPAVEVNYEDDDTEYSWHTLTETPVDATVATAYSEYGSTATYDSAAGTWQGVETSSGGQRDFFEIPLKAGDSLKYTVASGSAYDVQLIPQGDGDYVYDDGGVLNVPADDTYTFHTGGSSGNPAISVTKVAVGGALAGQSAKALTGAAPGTYLCKVTYADGTVLVSDTVTIEAPSAPAHVHTMQTGDAWTYNGDNHWRQCTDPDCPDLAGSKADVTAHTKTWDKDASQHWEKCDTCGWMDSAKADHDFGGDDVCDTCNYSRAPLPAAATPDIGIDYKFEELTGFVEDAGYTIGGEDVTLNAQGKLSVVEYMGRPSPSSARGTGPPPPTARPSPWPCPPVPRRLQRPRRCMRRFWARETERSPASPRPWRFRSIPTRFPGRPARMERKPSPVCR